MHSALKRLIIANAELENARLALASAEEERRQCARGLVEIEDPRERQDAAIYAYREFGTGLSIALAEAVTGLPGKKASPLFWSLLVA